LTARTAGISTADNFDRQPRDKRDALNFGSTKRIGRKTGGGFGLYLTLATPRQGHITSNPDAPDTLFDQRPKISIYLATDTGILIEAVHAAVKVVAAFVATRCIGLDVGIELAARDVVAVAPATRTEVIVGLYDALQIVEAEGDVHYRVVPVRLVQADELCSDKRQAGGETFRIAERIDFDGLLAGGAVVLLSD
jgi:hypothetical protein